MGSSVVVINIADASGSVSLEEEIPTSGSTSVDDAVHAVMAPDDSTVEIKLVSVSWRENAFAIVLISVVDILQSTRKFMASSC